MLDPALDTLFLPFATGALSWPEVGQILFLRARMGAALLDPATPRARLICRQSFLPFATELARAHLTPEPGAETPAGPFPLILSLPPRQRDEARFLLAESVARAAEGGTVLSAAANTEGARALESDPRRLAGAVTTLSKNKCRAFWARINAAKIDRTLLKDWLALGEKRPAVRTQNYR